MMSDAPLFWVKQINENLQELKEIPLWGSPPPFSLGSFFSKIERGDAF